MMENKDGLLTHHLRQTGRTMRMLTHMGNTLLKNPAKSAMVICPSATLVPTFKQRLEQLPAFTPDQIKNILYRTLFQPADLISPSMHTTVLNPPANSVTLYYVDHSVIELWYASALRELHRWDTMLRI